MSSLEEKSGKACKYGDPSCPCQDGDACHYEGENAWPPPAAYVREQKLEAKGGRRKFRHEIARRMRRIAIKRIGLCATKAQLKDATKILTDRYMHMVDHAPMKTAPAPAIVPERAQAECPAS